MVFGGAGLGGSFLPQIVPKYTVPKPVKKVAQVGGGAVAPMPKKPTILPVPKTTKTNTPMMSTATGAKPGYIKPATTPAPMMSTATGAKPGYIKTGGVITGGQSTAPATTPTKTTPTPVKKITPTSTPTVTATEQKKFTDINGNSWNTQAEADTASNPPAPTPEDTTTPGTTPDVPAATTPEGGDTTPPTYDPTGEDIALSQAEYMQQSKQQEEYLRSQRSIQTQVDTLTGEMSQLQSSDLIQKTSDDLDKLRHNLAYLGTQGQPGLSSVKMEAISKQVSDAQHVFESLKRLETDKESQRRLGLEYDAATFEKQMVDLHDQLNTNVNAAIQESLNGLTAAEMAGKMDTVEEVQALKGTLFQNLDKAIAGKIVANAADRKLIIQRYNDTIAQTEAWTVNKAKTDVETSKVNGYVTDGNGNARMGANGLPIPYVGESPYPPVFDKESGNMMTFSMGKDGKIVTTVQKVFEPTEPQLEWKPDGNGGFYRTGSGGKLETYGGTGTGRKALTNAEMIKLDEDLAAGNITQEIYDKYMNGGTSTNTSTSSQSVSQYKGPSYTAASLEKVQQAYTQAVSQGDGAWGGQCGSFVNNYLQDMGIARLFKDPIDVKKAVMNSTEATIGSIAIMNSTAKPKNGHVGIVTAINADGTLTLKQSNKDGSEKVFTSKVNASSVLGYFDPQIPQDQALMSTPTAAAPATSNVSAQAKLLAEYKLNPTEMAGLQRKSPASYEALTKEVVAINPNFDDTDYASKVQTVKDFSPGGKDATVIRDFNTATKHLGEMLNATKALDGSGLQFWNKITNAVGKATGNTNITNFETWRTMLAEEAAKVISGKSNFNEEEMQHFYDILDPSLSKKQLTSSLKQIMQGMVERSDTLGRMKAAFSYLPASSKQSITSLLDTRAIQTLKDQGLGDYLTELGITNSTSTSSTGAGRRINSQ